MSAKLIVHKFDSAYNFKSLHIEIDGEENSQQVKFSEWYEGKTHQKKKDGEKSRLVVKIVSGGESNDFNLDSCAKVVENYENINQRNDSQDANDNFSKKMTEMLANNTQRYHYSDNCYNDTSNEKTDGYATSGSSTLTAGGFDDKSMEANVIVETIPSPLEYSLEKVKANNARIMQNIHMLNRTLTYTKKKEILDIVYPKAMRSYLCNICGKCFVYETGLRRHYFMRHATAEMQPQWQVVWTCIECFQVWPQQDQAIKHSSGCCKSDAMDCIREIKTSSLLQCEFCEKVYTSIPRLLRHTNSHTTAANYECNVCTMVFACYKYAEQHRLVCPWLKMNYSFSLPKLLLCNGCDRKFRNYEQLYNHRYKLGHFTMKSHTSQCSNNLTIMVYQCEVCGQCFPSATRLQTHRTKYHPRFDLNLQGPVGIRYEGDSDEALTASINLQTCNDK